MKAEIEKILQELFAKVNAASLGAKPGEIVMLEPFIKSSTSSLTSLIIKWLEGKREQGIKFHSGRQNSELSAYSPTDNQKVGRNQLITELIGELR